MSFCCKLFGCKTRSNENPQVKSYKASYSTSLRGNLVRTYKTPIDDDYYIDNDHELGKGGCGVVVVGEHKETHAQYAIKIVNKSTAERGRLDRELKLLKDVDHANIVRLFSLYDLPTHMYFVMELCLGGHLGNLLSRQPAKCVDEDWGRKLARQLISAVAHIHSRGIAHRDIKLQNILVDTHVDKTAQLKLIDFGYGSRYIGALPMKTKCGTPYTTAPEVIRECYDERCDVWSMGVVIYIMLCGRRPFEALDIPGPLADAGKASMITNILAGRYHFNHKAWQNVSKAGIAFVKTLLHPDYKTRIHSHEALEVPWLSDGTVLTSQTAVLKSAKSFHAVTNMRRNSAATDMQKTGMVALVFGINSKAAVDLRSVFQSFDSDGSGMLSRQEFEKALREVSPDLSASDINHLFDIVDLDKNKQISYSEFLAATLDPNEVDIDELSKAFKLLDEDGNGFITKDELRKILTFQYEQANVNHQTVSNGAVRRNSRDLRNVNVVEQLHRIVEEKVAQIFSQVDVNGDGVISQGEFLCAMTGLDFYLDPNETFGPGDDDEDEEEDVSESNEQSTFRAPAPMSYQSSYKNQMKDLADDETNGEYEYVPEDDADDIANTIDRGMQKADSHRMRSQNNALDPTNSTKSRSGSGKNNIHAQNVRSNGSMKRANSSRKQSTLEPIKDESAESYKKLSRDSSISFIRRDSSKRGELTAPASTPTHRRVNSHDVPILSPEAMELVNIETSEGSPRRGVSSNAPGSNLAFYGVRDNIDVSIKAISEEESTSSSYSVHKVKAMFGTPPQKGQIQYNESTSPGRLSPINATSRSQKSGVMSPVSQGPSESGKNRHISPPPMMLNKTMAQGSFKGLAPLSRQPSLKRGGTGGAADFSDIRRGDDDEDRPVTDLRASFAAMGRAPSYRNSMIIENSSNNDTIRVMMDEVAARIDPRDDVSTITMSRKISRPGVPTYEGDEQNVSLAEAIEAPPPMLRMGSKAFSFKGLNTSTASRPTTGRRGNDDDYERGGGNDFPSDISSGPMFGSMKRMLSVGKLNIGK